MCIRTALKKPVYVVLEYLKRIVSDRQNIAIMRVMRSVKLHLIINPSRHLWVRMTRATTPACRLSFIKNAGLDYRVKKQISASVIKWNNIMHVDKPSPLTCCRTYANGTPFPMHSAMINLAIRQVVKIAFALV